MNSPSDSSATSDLDRAAHLVAEEGGAEEEAARRYENGSPTSTDLADAASERRRKNGDSGRERQPGSQEEVDLAAANAERLGGHNTPMDDDAGINPSGGAGGHA